MLSASSPRIYGVTWGFTVPERRRTVGKEVDGNDFASPLSSPRNRAASGSTCETPPIVLPLTEVECEGKQTMA